MAYTHPNSHILKLNLNGQSAGFPKTITLPTETSIVIGTDLAIGDLLNDWAFQEMQGQRRAVPGNILTLDATQKPIHCDAWDSSYIQQAEISEFDAKQSGFASLTLSLQVTNFREVPIPTPGAIQSLPFGLKDSRKSQLKERMLGRTVPSNLTPFPQHKDRLSSSAFRVTVSGSSTNIFVSKLGPLTYRSGVVAPFVITTAEKGAADFRTWKQSGGQRDVTVQYLDAGFRTALTIIYSGCTIAQIFPPVSHGVMGPASVTLNVGRITITY